MKTHIKTFTFIVIAMPLLMGRSLWAQDKINVNDPSLRPNIPLNQVSKPLNQDKKAVPINEAKQKQEEERRQEIQNQISHSSSPLQLPLKNNPPLNEENGH